MTTAATGLERHQGALLHVPLGVQRIKIIWLTHQQVSGRIEKLARYVEQAWPHGMLANPWRHGASADLLDDLAERLSRALLGHASNPATS